MFTFSGSNSELKRASVRSLIRDWMVSLGFSGSLVDVRLFFEGSCSIDQPERSCSWYRTRCATIEWLLRAPKSLEKETQLT